MPCVGVSVEGVTQNNIPNMSLICWKNVQKVLNLRAKMYFPSMHNFSCACTGLISTKGAQKGTKSKKCLDYSWTYTYLFNKATCLNYIPVKSVANFWIVGET